MSKSGIVILRDLIRESIRDDLMMNHPHYPNLTPSDLEYIEELAAEYEEFGSGENDMDSHDELAQQDETSGGMDRPL